MESSWTRDQTCVPCIGRQIPNHWTTREIPTDFLFACLLIAVVSLADLRREWKFQRNTSGEGAKLQLLWHVKKSGYVIQLNHQSGREAKHTQGSDESAMPSHRNVKYISLGGLSHIWCSKSMANRCSPGARESEEALVSRTGEDGGGEQAEGISLGWNWSSKSPSEEKTWEGMELA